MDAVSLLNKHANIEKVMNHYGFDRMREEGIMIRSCCGIHKGDSPSAFVANTESNLWFCHSQCGGGDMFTLVEKMEGIAFKHAVLRIATILGVDINTLEIIERKDEYVRDLQSFIKLMRKRPYTLHPPFDIDVDIRKVTRYRAFREDTLQRFGLCFVEEYESVTNKGDKFMLRKRLGVPITQNNVLVGYSLRATLENDKPKWAHIPKGINTSDMLYNLDSYDGQEEIVVVEGMYDVWAYYEIGVYAVCTYGAHLSEWQYRLLLNTGATSITLSYDGDNAGRAITEKAKKLLRNKFRVSYVPFNEGEDPEKITREELRERYENKRNKA